MNKIKLINRTIIVDFNYVQDSEYVGGSNSRTLKVYIRKDLAEDEKKRTFVHELIHNFEFGNSGLERVEEAKVESLTNELLYFLKNNKKIIEWLQEE